MYMGAAAISTEVFRIRMLAAWLEAICHHGWRVTIGRIHENIQNAVPFLSKNLPIVGLVCGCFWRKKPLICVTANSVPVRTTRNPNKKATVRWPFSRAVQHSHAPLVFPGTRIDLNLVASRHKQRHTELKPGSKLGRLQHLARGIAANRRLGVNHFTLDRGR